MKNRRVRSYPDRLRLRNRLLWGVLALMAAYMVVVGETGGGDSRMMTPLAEFASRVIFFGGAGCVIARIVHNNKLLKDRLLRQEQLQKELDERSQYLHDKSGGLVWDVLFVVLLFSTLTAALYDMAMFRMAMALLAVALVLKLGTYFVYSRWAQ